MHRSGIQKMLKIVRVKNLEMKKIPGLSNDHTVVIIVVLGGIIIGDHVSQG